MDVRKRERDDSFVLEEELSRPPKKPRLSKQTGKRASSEDEHGTLHAPEDGDDDDDQGSLDSLVYSEQEDDESLLGLPYVDEEGDSLGSFFDSQGRRRSRRISRMTRVSYVGMC